MSAPPLIGLSGRRRPAEVVQGLNIPALEGEEVDVHLSEFPKAVRKAGGLPVQLNTDTDPLQIVRRLDGVVLTGGSDLDPSFYGEEPHPDLGETDPRRDEWELALIHAALDAHLPMLCVCRGAQLLNVALGGTLIQHLDESDTHALYHRPRIERCHTVRVAPGTRAAELYGDELLTNSLHHQAVGRPGSGVVVTGTAEDGVVEAFELEGRPEVFAVQWHPEMLSDQVDPAFVWLVRQATG